MTILCALLMVLSVKAQNESNPQLQKKQANDTINDSTTPVFKNHFAIALNASTIGLGIEVARSLNQHLSLRLRYSSLELSNVIENENVKINNDDFKVNGGMNVAEIDLSLQYNPFKNSSFKLVGGLGYFTNAKVSGNGQPTKGSSYGEIIISPKDVGEINITIDYKGLAPYLGLGFGRAVPKNRVGISFEIGTFYLTNQIVELTGTNSFTSISDSQESFKNDISGYKWYPFVNVRLAVRI